MAGNNKNLKPLSDDYYEAMAEIRASFRNLEVGDHGEASLNHSFEVGSSSLSDSLKQGSQKDEVLHGEQDNEDQWQMSMNSFVPISQPETPICQENLRPYHYSIDGGNYQPSYLQSGSENISRNDCSNYLGYDPVTAPRTPLPSYLSYGSRYTNTQSLIRNESTFMPDFSSQNRGESLCNDQVLKWNQNGNGDYFYPTDEVLDCKDFNLQNIMKANGSSALDFYLEGVDLVKVAWTSTGCHLLCNILETRDTEIRKRVFVRLYDSIAELMTGLNCNRVLQKLICSCNDKEFQVLARKLTSDHRFLLEASFDKQGTFSVQTFIKKLKKSPMASTVTSILSLRFFEMMTHPIARNVIKQCLNIFSFLPNMVLYEAAINNCYILATHRVGCLSINDCIDSITGTQRDKLLQLLADQSAFLASDPSGNYVVQHILKTRHPLIVERICYSLRGHYKELSTKKGGSHVIEICVRYSSVGMTLAVQEFTENSKALAQLAKDEFGNYVVQTILEVTELESIELYKALVKALKPHIGFLENCKTGKNVAALIRKNQLEANELREEQGSVKGKRWKVKDVLV